MPAFPPKRALLGLKDLDFSRRTYKLRELLDEPCTFVEYARAMRDMVQANRLTRGYRPMLELLAATVERVGVSVEPLHVVDFGCGQGELLRAVRAWGARRSVPFRLTGVDAAPYAARLARECDRAASLASGEIRYVTGDLFAAELERAPDLAFCSLVAHHLPDGEVVRLLQRCAEAKAAWMVVDLRRSERAAKIFSAMGSVLGWHPAVKHDGVVSFARAFSLEEWRGLVERAGVAAEVRDLGTGRVGIVGA